MPTRRADRSRWTTPGAALLVGLVLLAAAWIGGDPRGGALAFAVMAAVAAVFAFGGRSDTIALMRRPDERWSLIDTRATAIAGLATVAVVLGAVVVRLARGEGTSPYSELAAVAGVAYLAALAWLRWRL